MKRKEIVLIKETRRKEFVRKVMDAIKPHLSLQDSFRVAIKINLSGQREIYANTNYETVESLIFYLKDNFGIDNITVIEGSDGAYYSGKTTWDIYYKFRYKEVELNGARLVNLDEQPHDKTLEIMTFAGPRTVSYTTFDTDYMINVAPPKTHNVFPICASIVNLLGFVKPEDRALMFGASGNELKKLNSYKTEKFQQLLENASKNFVKLLHKISPSLSLVDGLYGMEGKGPIKGSPVFHGFAIASEDVVLTDSLTSFIMGFDVEQVPYLGMAYRQGLGNNRWQNVIGVDPSQVKFPYRPHPVFQKLRAPGDNNHRRGGRGGGRGGNDRGGNERGGGGRSGGYRPQRKDKPRRGKYERPNK